METVKKSMTFVTDPAFAAGEEALKEKDYETAIAHFTAITTTELDETLVSRAHRALAVAYTQSGQIKKAIALCQSLVYCPPDSDWATQTLADLIARHPEALDPEYTEPKIQLDSENLLPVASAPSPKEADVFVPGRRWRNGERAKNWKAIKPLKLSRLWLVEVATIMALFWLLRFTLRSTINIISIALTNIFNIYLPQLFNNSHNLDYILGGFLLLLFILSPWLLDTILKLFYGKKHFSLSELACQRIETARLLQRTCVKKRIPLPKLGILPTYTPIAMSYGNIKPTARIVISQGLLETLSDEELATIYLTQLGHIINGDYRWMSGIMVLLQIPYTLYRQTAKLGEKLAPDKLKNIIAIIPALFYGIYWLWRVPVLWLSRRRCYYSDRFAAQYTGNPNALIRALLKITIAMAEQVKFQGHTNWLLEGFDLLEPVGQRQAISLGAIPDYTPYEKVLAWECTNPYRKWLEQVNSHPLLGDRLYLLGRYAYFWRLEPEIDLPALRRAPQDNRAKLIKMLNCYQALPILQSAFLSGLLFGIISRNLLRFIGILCNAVGIWQLDWLVHANPFLNACILFAFSFSIIIWINGYFPDIQIAPTRQEPPLQDLLKDENALPPSGEGVRLSGKLLGRKGIANLLVQDLILETSNGLIKLHFFSWFGPLGNLFPFAPHPHQFVGENVTVSGWFRRSSTPWLDIDTLETSSGKIIRAGYPIWTLILAIGSALVGAYLIIQS